MTPEPTPSLEVTREATTTVDAAGAGASANWWRDAIIMSGFITCVLAIAAIAGSCIFHVPQEWQLPKDVISILGTLAGQLLTGYFALQVGSRK